MDISRENEVKGEVYREVVVTPLLPSSGLIQFRLHPTHMPRGRETEKQAKGELCVMRVSCIMCLFPEQRQIRTIEHGWTLTVCEDDWGMVEEAFIYGDV